MAKAPGLKTTLPGKDCPVDTGEAHEHLHGQCAWYRDVCDGQNVAEAGGGCTHTGKVPEFGSRLVIKATPETPEASTVDKPTVPPGGPGLFHVKGLHLPPYIQHLWFHLAERYGKERAYGIAVGVVKKWAQGINPGGWVTKSGKGKRTHPDVQAAAQRNVAQWEADIAQAHHHTAATSPLDRVLALASVSKQALGPKLVTVKNQDPPPGLSRLANATSMAHRLNMAGVNLSHAKAHMVQALKSKKQIEEAFNADHVLTHLIVAADNMRRLTSHLDADYPAEGRELKALLGENAALSAATDPKARVATTAHLAETVCHHVSHSLRHARAYGKDSPSQASRTFNLEHADHHIDVALEHAGKIVTHFMDNYPKEARQLRAVDWPEGLGIPLSEVKLAASAAKPAGILTAPGTNAQLQHQPSQTVSPSPPLPPGIKLPTQAECDKIAASIEKDAGGNALIMGAVRQLRDAGVKLAKKEPIHALSQLRAAQMGVLAGHYELKRNAIPVANVFSVATGVPPAATSSAHSAMAESVTDREKFRKHYIEVSGLIDRVRRHHFHGMYGGLAEARFTRTDLEKAIIAAAAGVD